MKDEKKQPLVDVIVPVYKPGEKFFRQLAMLHKQTYPIGRIIVMNTGREYWPAGLKKQYPDLEVHHITKAQFDHGATRHLGTTFSAGDIFVCLTDDAVPADEHLIEQLVLGFAQKGAGGERPAMVYGRQLTDGHSGVVEGYTRSFNYPAESRVKTAGDLPALGIKTYFASNVCCAYDRSIYDRLGGFIRQTIFNEDMIYAAGAIKAGYAVVYQAGAKVVHAHRYGCAMLYKRNFDLGVSQADHPEVFAGVPAEKEGVRLVKKTAGYLVRKRKFLLLADLFFKTAFKYLGYRMGKNYQRLPKKVIAFSTMNPNYWEKGR